MDNTSFANLDILLSMNAAPVGFLVWFRSALKERNWNIRTAAGQIGISHPMISKIVTYGEMPSFDTCLAIARTFKIRPEFVLRLASLLPPIDERTDEQEEILFIFKRLSPADKQIIIEQMRFYIERRQHNASADVPEELEIAKR